MKPKFKVPKLSDAVLTLGVTMGIGSVLWECQILALPFRRFYCPCPTGDMKPKFKVPKLSDAVLTLGVTLGIGSLLW